MAAHRELPKIPSRGTVVTPPSLRNLVSPGTTGGQPGSTYPLARCLPHLDAPSGSSTINLVALLPLFSLTGSFARSHHLGDTHQSSPSLPLHVPRRHAEGQAHDRTDDSHCSSDKGTPPRASPVEVPNSSGPGRASNTTQAHHGLSGLPKAAGRHTFGPSSLPSAIELNFRAS